MSDLVLPYIATLGFISFLIWIYTKEYRIAKVDLDKQRLDDLDAKINKVLAALALRGR